MIQWNGAWYQATTNYSWLTDYDGDATITSIHLMQINGFGPNEQSCIIDFDADNNETITTTTIDRVHNLVTTVATKPNTSALSASTIYQNGRIISLSTLSVPNPTLYSYDSLGVPISFKIRWATLR